MKEINLFMPAIFIKECRKYSKQTNGYIRSFEANHQIISFIHYKQTLAGRQYF
jgi:hypothetical protein